MFLEFKRITVTAHYNGLTKKVVRLIEKILSDLIKTNKNNI